MPLEQTFDLSYTFYSKEPKKTNAKPGFADVF
jgi:hypothetical protein